MSRTSLTLSVSTEFKDFINYLAEQDSLTVGREIENLLNFRFLKDKEILNLFFSKNATKEEILKIWETLIPEKVKFLREENKAVFGKKTFSLSELPENEVDLKNLLFDATFQQISKNEEDFTLEEFLKTHKIHLIAAKDGFDLIPERGSKIKKVLKLKSDKKKEIFEVVRKYLLEEGGKEE